mmetsp:Transcript_130635/g.225939  ORF Transcript_130635/g.225939 Transcript_130635/m.225939 type:complete len:211 (-) Transcript_130635:194-826(-)
MAKLCPILSSQHLLHSLARPWNIGIPQAGVAGLIGLLCLVLMQAEVAKWQSVFAALRASKSRSRRQRNVMAITGIRRPSRFEPLHVAHLRNLRGFRASMLLLDLYVSWHCGIPYCHTPTHALHSVYCYQACCKLSRQKGIRGKCKCSNGSLFSRPRQSLFCRRNRRQLYTCKYKAGCTTNTYMTALYKYTAMDLHKMIALHCVYCYQVLL